MNEITNEMLDFIHRSPSCYHAVSNIREILRAAGFEELKESQSWNLQNHGCYFVVRNESSIIAFMIGDIREDYGFHIAASHDDSPAFKIKEQGELCVAERYCKLNVEGYGGMIMSSWMDRPLSIAGRIMVKKGNHLSMQLVNMDRDIAIIPNLAIHMNREVNTKNALNAQIDMLPLVGLGKKEPGWLKNLIAEDAHVNAADIYGMDLFLYNRMKGMIWGMEDALISSPKLDNLACAYTTLQGFLQGKPKENVNVYACFDNEEVGSTTKQGAASTFLYDTLHRINMVTGHDEEAYHRSLANSFMVSADNAHAVHPNHPEKSDATNSSFLNEGIVIKQHANQKYTSDAISTAIFKAICERSDVPYQFFANRSDMNGGSTLGNISNTQVSLHTVDIGLPQLAMHSSYETAGSKDCAYMVKAMKAFYQCCIREDEDGFTIK